MICQDESTYTTNASHLRIFVRGFLTNIEILKEFIGLVLMQRTTKNKVFLKTIVECTIIICVCLKLLSQKCCYRNCC